MQNIANMQGTSNEQGYKYNVANNAQEVQVIKQDNNIEERGEKLFKHEETDKPSIIDNGHQERERERERTKQ